MKITVSVTKSSDRNLCYLHLPIFFLYIHSPVLLQNTFLCRPSQIACTFTTMNNEVCTQVALHIHENLFTEILWICQFVCLFMPCARMILSCIPERAINRENCQLPIGAINLSQLRTTFHPPTQTIMI